MALNCSPNVTSLMLSTQKHTRRVFTHRQPESDVATAFLRFNVMIGCSYESNKTFIHITVLSNLGIIKKLFFSDQDLCEDDVCRRL